MWLQEDFGNWSSYGGGGYWLNPGAGNKNYWFMGIQLQNQIRKNWSIGGELFHTTPMTVDGRSRTGFDIGTVYDFEDGHHLLFSLGRTFQGESVTSAYIAFQWTFGPHGR